MASEKKTNNLEKKVSDYEVSDYKVAKAICKDVGRGVYKAGAGTCKGVCKAGIYTGKGIYYGGKWSLLSAVGTPKEVSKHVPGIFSGITTSIEVIAGGVVASLAVTSGIWPLAAAGGYALLDGITKIINDCRRNRDFGSGCVGLLGLARVSIYKAAKSLAPKNLRKHYGKKIIKEIEMRRNRKFNHVKLYKKNPKLFRSYFDDLSDERKEDVLKDIIPICDANVELKMYLEKNYAEMIKNVGRDSLIE